MAPLPVTSTVRYKYNYANAQAAHSLMLRVVETTPTSDVDTIVQTLLTNVGIHCEASSITGVEKALLGSSIFNPVSDSTLVGATFGSFAGNAETNSTAACFVGRGSDGRRSRIFLFGWAGTDNNWRVTGAEDVDVASMVTFLNTPSTPLLTIGGTAPVFKNYMDIKPNDHWVKKGRS